MEKYDVIIIGGGPGGITTALTSKKLYPDKKICIIRKEETLLIPCAIPYLFNTIDSIEKNLIPNEMFEKNGIDLIIDEVIDVDTKQKVVKTKSGRFLQYEKLVISTGSRPRKIFPEKSGLFYMPKNKEYIEKMLEWYKKSKRIVVIGGGFIGVEFSTEAVKNGKEVTIIEAQDRILPVFDKEFSEEAEKLLKSMGVKILVNKMVKNIEGEERVEKVVLEDEEIETDMVLVSVGFEPNLELAKKIGLEINRGIVVNEKGETSEKDVYAVGDCIERNAFEGGKRNTMLASLAVKDGRIVARNLFGKTKSQIKDNPSFSTVIGGKVFSITGLTEEELRNKGIKIKTSTVTVFDRHPSSIKDVSEIRLKMIFEEGMLKILGAQIIGGKTASEIINILSLSIEKGLTAEDLFSLSFSSHPLLSPSPVMNPIFKAIDEVIRK